MNHFDLVVVGASIAGVAAVEYLRRAGYSGSVAMIDREPYPPYDKPPLSKKALSGEWSLERLALRPPGHFDDLDVRLFVGAEARRIENDRLEVALDNGDRLAANAVLAATGARPRTLRHSSPQILTLRGRDDALELRQAIQRGGHLVIIGGGFIGLEVAATARIHGLAVTVVEAETTPLIRAVGERVAGALMRAHQRRGVTFSCGVSVADVHEENQHLIVRLSDGTVLPAQTVLAGIGTIPNVEWLKGSGVETSDGVLCDEHGRSSRPDVSAAGDCAAWPHHRTRKLVRGHHWTRAREQGEAVARQILGTPVPVEHTVPYVWSDQFGLRLQCYGDPGSADRTELTWGRLKDESFVVRHMSGPDLVGVSGLNASRQIRNHLPDLHREWGSTNPRERAS